ncbi:MFS transporter [Methylobacterium nodulans]|uniref:MFS transporter n=1 Tax=Methylobacterium nodulans TaxID=114616 RepID=UPI0006809285|nr:MFS transporter [Methylobacterium nodulans]
MSRATRLSALLGVARSPRQVYFGWWVVVCAFVVATFAWGVGFYGPSIFLAALHLKHGWPVSLTSAAVTAHFLVSAGIVSQIARLHVRLGLVAVTRLGAASASAGMLGWALAAAPWQLFPAALLTGTGFALTSGAAINAMVSPWFRRLRPAALGAAFNGASVGGIVFAPLWQFLIVRLDLLGAAVVMGAAMTGSLWWCAGRFLRPTPESLGLLPDGAAVQAAEARAEPAARQPALPAGAAALTDRRFLTLSAAFSLGLFAQIGIIVTLVLVAAPMLGEDWASVAVSLVTACAIAGRTLVGMLLPARSDWRIVASGNFTLQAVGTLALVAAGTQSLVLLLAGCVLFGIGVGSQLSLPPQIAGVEFTPTDAPRVMALVTAANQTSYAFAPAILGLLRDLSRGSTAPLLMMVLMQALAAAIVLSGRSAAGSGTDAPPRQ